MSSIGNGISQRRSTTRMRTRSSASSAEARRRIRTPLQNVSTVRCWVAGFLHGLATKAAPTERLEILNINGDPGLGIFDGDELTGVISLTTSDARITRVDIIRAPGKPPHQT